MRRGLVILAALVIIAVGAIVFVALPSDDDSDSESADRFRAIERTYVGGTHRLELAGIDVGPVKVVSLGGPFAEAVSVVQQTEKGNVVVKQPGRVQFADVVVEIGAGMAKPLFDWVLGAINGPFSRMDGAINSFDEKGAAASRTQFRNALLTEIQLPVCDAASTEQSAFRLTFAVESHETIAGGAKAAAATTSKQLLAANCRVLIPGVETNRVAKVDGITFKQKIKQTKVISGSQEIDQKAPDGPVDIANFKIEFSQISLPSWNTWFTDLVLKGNVANEKALRIDWLDASLKSSAASVEIPRCGLLKLQGASAADATVAKWLAELYCETGAIKLTA